MVSFDFIIKLYLVTYAMSGAISYGSARIFHFTVWLVVAAFVHFNIKSYKIKIPRLSTHVHYAFYFMLIWFLFSSLWCYDLHIWKKFFVKYVYGVFTVVVIVYYCRSMDRFKVVGKLFVILFVMEVVVALLENITGYHLPASRYNQFGAWFGKPVVASEIYNNHVPTGFEWNPNNFAMKLACFFPFVMLHEKWWIKIVGSCAVLYVLVATGSQASLLGVIFAVGIYFVLYERKKLFFILGALLILGILLSQIDFHIGKDKRSKGLREMSKTFNSVMQYIDFNGEAKTDSASERQKLTQNGWLAFKNSNGLGIGLGSTIEMQRKYNDFNILNMHNYWLEILTEGGFFVFFAFSGVFIYLMFRFYNINAQTARSSDIKYFSQGFLIAYCAFALACVSPSSAVHVPSIWILFGMGVAFVNITQIATRNK